ncbi:MAG: ADP-ribosylglycohydrolase family protein [Eubacteriales bacterium]
MGLAVGDAMGVPVEFHKREELDRDPVFDFREHGTFDQPLGTWSDDTSLTLCLLDSLSGGLDYGDIMDKFQQWGDTGAYTPLGTAFDMGRTTINSLYKFKLGVAPLMCGGDEAADNGNGSLMRILPAAFYLYAHYGTDVMNDAAMEIVHRISGLTHRHPRSLIACGIYVNIAVALIGKGMIKESVSTGVRTAIDYYNRNPKTAGETKYYQRLLQTDKFAAVPVKNIRSSGYVVDTIEAALWCLLTTFSYPECILKAVNLGEDTDTVAAVAGGLAGISYGYASFSEMGGKLVKSGLILSLCEKFEQVNQGH